MCLGSPKMAIIAQRFNAGYRCKGPPVPLGRKKFSQTWKDPVVPTGTQTLAVPKNPAFKRLGYFSLPMCGYAEHTYNLAGAVDRKSGPKINNLTIHLSRRFNAGGTM